MPRLSWPASEQKTVYVPGSSSALTVSDSPTLRSAVAKTTSSASSRTVRLCGVGPSLVTSKLTVGPLASSSDGSIMKSATLTVIASANGVSALGGAVTSGDEEQATRPMSSAGNRSWVRIGSTFREREEAARSIRTASLSWELLEALRLRGHDGLRQRIAQHAHVHGCVAVGIRRGRGVTAALSVHDRCRGEHVLGDQLGKCLLGEPGGSGQECAELRYVDGGQVLDGLVLDGLVVAGHTGRVVDEEAVVSAPDPVPLVLGVLAE